MILSRVLCSDGGYSGAFIYWFKGVEDDKPQGVILKLNLAPFFNSSSFLSPKSLLTSRGSLDSRKWAEIRK